MFKPDTLEKFFTFMPATKRLIQDLWGADRPELIALLAEYMNVISLSAEFSIGILCLVDWRTQVESNYGHFRNQVLSKHFPHLRVSVQYWRKIKESNPHPFITNGSWFQVRVCTMHAIFQMWNYARWAQIKSFGIPERTRTLTNIFGECDAAITLRVYKQQYSV